MKNNKPTLFWHFPHLLLLMGGTKYVLELGAKLTRTYQVTIVTNKADRAIKNSFQDRGITVVETSHLTTNSIVYWLLLPLLLLYDTVASLRYLRAADVVVCTSFPSNFICFVNKKLFHKKYHFLCFEPFIFFHNKEYIQTLPAVKQLLLRVLAIAYGSLDLLAAHNASMVVTIDSYKAELIKKTYQMVPKNIGVGVDTEFFSRRNNTAVAAKYKDRSIIFHCTDYTPLKGTADAIKAFALLWKDVPDVVLLVSSTKPDSREKQHYQDLAKSLGIAQNVMFLGLVPENDLPSYYSAALCYLSTSQDMMTATNLPVKEALACATPALRALPSSGDVVDGESGYIIDPKKHAAVAQKMKYLAAHPLVANEMGAVGRKRIIVECSWDSVADRFVSAIA